MSLVPFLHESAEGVFFLRVEWISASLIGFKTANNWRKERKRSLGASGSCL
jgi:hypothetical protein